MSWERIDNECVFISSVLEEKPMIRTYIHKKSWKLLSFYLGHEGHFVTNYEEGADTGWRAYFSVSVFNKSEVSNEFPYVEMEQQEVVRLFRETIPSKWLSYLLDGVCSRFEDSINSGNLIGKEEITKICKDVYKDIIERDKLLRARLSIV